MFTMKKKVRSQSKTSLKKLAGMLVTSLVLLVCIGCSATMISQDPETALRKASVAKTLVLPAQRTFVHPGGTDSKDELDFTKAKIAAGEQPWLSKFNEMKSKATGYTKTTSPQDLGQASENEQKEDATKAYANALTWYYTGNTNYAQNAIAVLNVWSKTFNGYAVPPLGQGSQSQLDCAWIGAIMGKAAEIMRGYSGWAPADLAAVQNMFKTKFYPALNQMSTWNGNVDLTQIDAMMNIAVFCEDTAEFNLAIQRLESRTPNYFYLISDGTRSDAGVWFNPLKWVDGLTQETCRDNGHHTQFAMASAFNAAEVAWHQGVDIYGVFKDRYTAAIELLATELVTGSMQGVSANNTATSDLYNTFEIGYNHYYNRKGISLPNTWKLLTTRVRVNSANEWNILYETLTHDRDGAGILSSQSSIAVSSAIVSSSSSSRISSSVSSSASSVSAPFSIVPGKIEAESYTAMSGIQTEVCSEGTLNVGWINTGDWFEYSVNVQTTGSYTIEYRAAALNSGGKVDIIANGQTKASTAIPSTGGWQTWTTITTAVNLSAGKQTIRLLASGAGWNLNYMNFKINTVSSTPVSSSSSSSKASSSSAPASSAPASSSSSAGSSSSSGVVYTVITAPFTFDGAGIQHWKIAVIPSYINDWNLSALTINGKSFLNLYVTRSQLPPQQEGYYYIDYNGPYSWSHIEIK